MSILHRERDDRKEKEKEKKNLRQANNQEKRKGMMKK